MPTNSSFAGSNVTYVSSTGIGVLPKSASIEMTMVGASEDTVFGPLTVIVLGAEIRTQHPQI